MPILIFFVAVCCFFFCFCGGGGGLGVWLVFEGFQVFGRSVFLCCFLKAFVVHLTF